MKIVVTGVAAALLAGCVTQGEHDQAMAAWAKKLQDCQTAAANAQKAAEANTATLQQRISALDGTVLARDRQIADELAKIADLQRKLDDANALSTQLSSELQKAGKDVNKLMAEKGEVAKALDDAKERLEELRKAQAAAQKRADLLRDLLLKFKRMIDSGELKIVLRDGRMVLQLRNDVLFDSGRVEVKPAGKDALREVAGVLKTLTDRKLQVAGHTDNVPIQTERFPSNWELSASRAISVVKFLNEEGIPATTVSAAGYADNDPVAANDTPEGRAKNRRIEIVLQPNIAELVAIPDAK